MLGQYVRARLMQGQMAMEEGDGGRALSEFQGALQTPENLSEARHLLSNQSDIFYWMGQAFGLLGQEAEAVSWWQRAARQHGDFQQMSVRLVSDMTYWTGMAYVALGDPAQANRVFQEIIDYARALEQSTPKIDFFATSLPAMLLFEEDLVRRNQIESCFLLAQGAAGLRQDAEAREMLSEVLRLDSNHAGASDLIRQLGSR